jgi:molecular chaperone GrpE
VVNSKKKRDFRVERYEEPKINPESTSSAAHAQSAPASVSDTVSNDPAILQQELASQKADYVRLVADFDNFIKRTQRDSEQQAAVEKETFIRELLPIIDNLERALASAQSHSSEPLFEGVKMTLQQVGQLLGCHGIEPVADRGRPFDPHRHEAISVQHDPTQPDRIVLEVTQRGYYRSGKVFRPAKVIVNDLSHYPGTLHAR